jgi:PAS domain S-box-containing protein
MKDSETGQRGYLITGDDRYLEPYNAAVVGIQDSVQRLKHLTEDNPRQQARIPPLEKQISAKLKELALTIALRKKDPEAARQVVLTDEGRKIMGVIRAQVQEMQQEERDLLVTRERESRQSYLVAALTILITVVLGLGMVGAIVYVLQRYLAERQKAARSLARLAAIVESSDDAILSKDLNGIIQTWNAGAERLFGYRAEEAIGQPITLLLPPERIQEEEQILERVLSGQRVEHLETVRVTKDGRPIDVSVTVSPVKDQDGQIIGASKIIRDITDRKRAEEELRSLKDELEHRVEQRTAELAASNGELEAFSYTVSHDLRAPLRHITSFVALLDEEAQASLNEQCRHYMQNISEAAQRMGQLIDDLLTFSRIGRAAMTVRPVSLRRLVDEARTELASETDGRAIDWEIGSLPEVSGDPALLRSVMVNLLSNAIKYTRRCETARIEVGCREEAGEVICFVRDNGAGFDMKFSDKLFGVFQRLHRAEDFDGTGIGLASVRRAVHRHGGRTWAEGELARGATFYFSLPCRRNDV